MRRHHVLPYFLLLASLVSSFIPFTSLLPAQRYVWTSGFRRRPSDAWVLHAAPEPPDVKNKGWDGTGKGEKKAADGVSARGRSAIDSASVKKAQESARLELAKAQVAARDAAKKAVEAFEDLELALDKAAKEAVKEASELAGQARELTGAALEKASAGARDAAVAFEELEERAQELTERALEKASAGAKDAIEALEDLEVRAQELTETALERASASSKEAAEVLEKAQQELTELAGRRKVRDDEESFSVTTELYNKGEFWQDLENNGVNPRRLILYNLLGLGVALGGNLFGVTSALLGLAPEKAGSLKLDIIYPVKGFTRYVDEDDGYEFQLPQEWLADQAVALAKERDRALILDPLSVKELERRKRLKEGGSRPDAAFGPPGGGSGENVSVVKSTVMPGFTLHGNLGEPRAATEKLLATVIAPPGSGRSSVLLDAFEEVRGASNVYQFEYTVKADDGRFFLHCFGVVAPRGEDLYTLTVLAPERAWGPEKQEKLGRVARSFRLLR